MKDKDQLMIKKIETGTVIDHLSRGTAIRIANLLGLDQRAQKHRSSIAIGMNFDSRSGLKDFIKIADFDLTDEQLAAVALLAPEATVNVIRNFEVVRKFQVPVPAEVLDIVVCPDQFCITNHESVRSRFEVTKLSPLTLRCHYCETEFYDKLIKFKHLE